MRKNRRNIKKISLHPILTYGIMIFIVILVSALLALLNMSGTHIVYSEASGAFEKVTEAVTSVLNLRGVKFIYTNIVSGFANSAVLSNLIIILFSIGIMEKSGFLETFVTIVTKRMKKTTVTFWIVLICLLLSISGDIAYLVMIPLAGLIYYHGKRNPAIGIIAAYGSLCCGTGISLIFTSVDSALSKDTLLMANQLDPNYTIGAMNLSLVNVIAIILAAFMITRLVENKIAKDLPKYEFEDTSIEQEVMTKKKLRGLIYAGTVCFIYILIFIYNIIPGLPFSGNLLDYSQHMYIDKLFSYDSFFTKGFVFVIAMLFVLAGLFYGIGARTIKNTNDFADGLGHSLNGIGKIIVMIFMSTSLITIFKYSNIGNTVVTVLTDLLSKSGFTGLTLVLALYGISIVTTLLVPSAITNWSIMNNAVTTTMNAGISPIFTQFVFRIGQCVTICLTPLFSYFVIYLAYLEHYNQGDKQIRIFTALKYMLYFALIMLVIGIALILIFYLTNLPLGIGGYVSAS